MSIKQKIQSWWKGTTLTEKILMALGGVTTAAAVTGAVYVVKTYTEMEDKLTVDVKLYPKGKDDPNPVSLSADEENTTEEQTEKITADISSDKWEVWNPEWEPVRKSADGYEGTRLNDALKILYRMDGMMKNDGYVEDDDVRAAEARVEDLARQFAYLEDREDEFRKEFPYLKNTACDIYENVEGE